MAPLWVVSHQNGPTGQRRWVYYVLLLLLLLWWCKRRFLTTRHHKNYARLSIYSHGSALLSGGLQSEPGFTHSFVNGQHSSPLEHAAASFGSHSVPGLVGVRHLRACGQQ